MDKKDLSKILNKFILNKESILAEIYFVLKENENTILRFVDLEESAQKETTRQIIDNFEKNLVNDDEVSVISISNSDDRNNVIYEYDLEEVPEDLTIVNEVKVNDEIKNFSFSDDSLESLHSIMILLVHEENSIITFKKNYPINLIRKDGINLMKFRFKNNTRFINLDEDIVKISPSFDIFKVDSTLFINELKVLEKFFGFHDIIEKKAKKCIETINGNEILENPEDLIELVEDDISFARKLTKVNSSSPVLGNIPGETIIQFVKDYPSLNGKFRFNEEGSRILLTSKKSKNLFVKLLNDDFLHSELTKRYYDSLAKDSL
ncbi:DUF4868 domain-containing protein [Halobacillus salinarum]|uniref:DUF4868 domain-containing protein n=1 Tax=Halobacillus salinarum TaxID=2932257 RepID=A0ABY4EIE4_9BACI|nr:anti-phage protein KwaB [Halobacillus salinarum]UOQ43394.1 DUF4868 domain-containing protein [Halobacillus salinarum]